MRRRRRRDDGQSTEEGGDCGVHMVGVDHFSLIIMKNQMTAKGAHHKSKTESMAQVTDGSVGWIVQRILNFGTVNVVKIEIMALMHCH